MCAGAYAFKFIIAYNHVIKLVKSLVYNEKMIEGLEGVAYNYEPRMGEL